MGRGDLALNGIFAPLRAIRRGIHKKNERSRFAATLVDVDAAPLFVNTRGTWQE
jgi:hypothetical protein